MTTPLPPATDFTGSSVTEGGFKTALTALRTFLSDLLGSTGNASDARVALGVRLDKPIQVLNTTGSANAYVASPTDPWTAYSAGQCLVLTPNFTNTSNATINVSGLGPVSLVDAEGVVLRKGQIKAGEKHLGIMLSGAAMQLQRLAPAKWVQIASGLSATSFSAEDYLDITQFLITTTSGDFLLPIQGSFGKGPDSLIATAAGTSTFARAVYDGIDSLLKVEQRVVTHSTGAVSTSYLTIQQVWILM